MIKLMKKTLFAVLVCTLMTLTLTGCGSKVETDILIIMAHPYITITVITMQMKKIWLLLLDQ